jgi:ribosomal protein S18 acetylase RimI-like enzyme
VSKPTKTPACLAPLAMILRQRKNPVRWRKIPKDEHGKAENFLKTREKLCVAASARFLKIKKTGGHVWYLNGPDGKISALLIHNRQSLFPVFNKKSNLPGPRFLNRFLGKVKIHTLQGLEEDAGLLESLMEEQGYFASERINYDLLSLDTAPRPEAFKSGPASLTLRKPAAGDTEKLFALQSAYEKEEVLPKNAVFNPSVSRLNLEHILSSESVLVAELDGQVVGKINTSAESFTRCQIGGVYVRPDCRGLGIALKMTAVFARDLLSRGKGVTLFVKKRNLAARAVYRKAGFSVLADYRISYY